MIFKTIADEANYYRDLTDYKLMGNGYVIAAVVGIGKLGIVGKALAAASIFLTGTIYIVFLKENSI